MKAKILLRMPALILVFLLLEACAPTIHYLGEVHHMAPKLDVFYDEKDVPKKYKVIGNMTNQAMGRYQPTDIQQAMIKKARQVGANGLIFHTISSKQGNDCDPVLTVEAKAIRYLENVTGE